MYSGFAEEVCFFSVSLSLSRDVDTNKRVTGRIHGKVAMPVASVFKGRKKNDAFL